MKVINTTESDRRLADGTRAVRGKPVEVDDVLGADLVDQGWKAAPVKTSDKKSTKTPAPADPPDGDNTEGA